MAKLASPRAELTVLRGMCSKDRAIAGTLIRQVDESYFYSPESQELYHAFLRNMSESGEAPTYRLMLEDPNLTDEARAHLRNSEATVTTVNEAKVAAKILNGYRQNRGLYNIGQYLKTVFESSKVDRELVLSKITSAVSTIRATKSAKDDFTHFGKGDNASKLINNILYDDNSEDLIASGIKDFDSVSGGFARGSLVTIGANSGGGKSTLASAMAVKMCNLGYRVLVVPLEMSAKEMTCRIMANVTKTDLTQIITQKMTDNEKALVESRMLRWRKKVKAKGGRYTVYKPPVDMDIEELMAAISAYECDVVIIDYISLLKGTDGDDQWQKLGATARYAKINAENMHRVNILLCQVSDEGIIRYARSISEHSTNSWVWVAKRDEKDSDGAITVKVDQAKSRNSLAFPFYMKIIGKFMRVESVENNEAFSQEKSTEEKRTKRIPNLAEADV